MSLLSITNPPAFSSADQLPVAPPAPSRTECIPVEDNKPPAFQLEQIESIDALFAKIGFKEMAEKIDEEDAAKKQGRLQLLDASCANVLGLESYFGMKDSDHLLAPHPKLLRNHNKLSATQLILSGLKTQPDRPHAKVEYYVNALLLLDRELEYFMLINTAVETNKLCRTLESIIFETMPTRFMGNLFFTQILPTWDLQSTDGYACYLRFSKKLQNLQLTGKNCLTNQDKKALQKLVKRGDPSVTAQATFFAIKWRQSELSEKIGKLDDAREHVLADLNKRLALPDIVASCKWITPAFGFLLSLELERIKVLTCNGTYDPKTDKNHLHYTPLYEQFFKDIFPGYLQKQAQIYQKCYEYLKSMAKNDPSAAKALDVVKMPSSYLQVNASFAQDFKIVIPKAKALSQELLQRFLTLQEKKAPRKRLKPKQLLPPAAAKEEPATAKDETPPYQPPPLVSGFMTPRNLLWHSRISRWMNLNPANLLQIRHFTDTREGQSVSLYERLNEEELKQQFLFHGFSRLIDKIFVDDALRKKYSFETERGAALFAELIQPNQKSKKAVIYYGLDNKLCFHRLMEIKEESDFQRLTMAHIAAAGLSSLIDDKEPELAEELSSGFVGDDVIFDEELEIIKVIDKKHACQINIFPLQ